MIGVIGGLVAIAGADLATGADVTLRALYLLPIGAGAWWLGRRTGIVLAIVSVAVASYVDVVEPLVRIRPVFVYTDAAVRLAVYLAATYVLAALHDAQARLAQLAQTDPLTALNNRRGFERLAHLELQRASRLATSLTIAIIDLDGFKAANDTLGHREGDLILATVGDVLRRSRSSDVAARLGGDEFAVLFAHTRREDGRRMASTVLERLTRAMSARGWPIRFSAGAATYYAPSVPVDEMIARADALMYVVKRRGGGDLQHEIAGDGAPI